MLVWVFLVAALVLLVAGLVLLVAALVLLVASFRVPGLLVWCCWLLVWPS